MKLDEKELQFLYRAKKFSKMPLWPSISALLSAAWIAIFHRDKFGLEGLITIESLILLLILVLTSKKRSEGKLIDIVTKLTES